MRVLLHTKVKLGFLVLWCLAWPAVAALLLLPLGVATPGRMDLLAHFLLFGGMAFAAVGFAHRTGQLLLMATITIVFGAGFEVAQGFVPYRQSDMGDALIGALGSVVGCGLALLMCRYLIRPAAAEPVLATPIDS